MKTSTICVHAAVEELEWSINGSDDSQTVEAKAATISREKKEAAGMLPTSTSIQKER
jgi:hypothetical protein